MVMVIKETKVQVTGGSLRTSIPSYIVDSLGIKKGDTVRWLYDSETKQITVEAISME
jgi:antitoxin component of MazEF toxin-antitoxin module